MAVYPERRSTGLTGKWIAEVTQAGDRRRKRFDTKLEATRWADYIKLTGAAPEEAVETPNASHTFGAVVAEAKVNHPGWARGRDPNLGQRLAFAVDVFGKDTLIENIRRADFDKLVNRLKNRPGVKAGTKLSPATINRYLSAASAVLTYAVAREYIVAVPSLPWQVEAGKRIQWLTDDHEAALSLAILSEGRRDEELTLRVLSATGLRWGEFEGLVPGMIDGEWIKLDATKTDTPRDVPIAPELAAELLELVKRGVPKYYTFRNTLKRALKAAGQSSVVSVHSLRHTTATRLVHNDVNLAVVQKFLGHRNINTTLKYTHVSNQLLQDARKKVSPHAGQSVKSAVLESSETPENTEQPEGVVTAPRIFHPVNR